MVIIRKIALIDYSKKMWKVEEKINDYHYTTQVIEFLKGLDNDEKLKNIAFWTERKNQIEKEIFDLLKTMKPDEIKILIQDKLLYFLTNKDG